MPLYRHELKSSFKSLLIWCTSMCVICMGCILLYGSVQDSIADLGDMFSNMGVMSAAFSMDKISIATMNGYYATEVALIHALGGAMYAALLASSLLSKEEAGHTAEFLLTLPLSRKKTVTMKALAMLTNITAFQFVCTAGNALAFVMMSEEIPWKEMLTLAGAQWLLFVEIAAVSYFFSAATKRNRASFGLGLTLIAFAADLMCRIVPAIKSLKYITPFYYAGAADIFLGTADHRIQYLIAACVILLSILGAYTVYCKKDIAA